MTKLKKEIKRFLVAGTSAVGTDLGTYYLLLFFLPYSASKAISFLAGTVVSFFINKYWTFEKKEKNHSEIWKFGLLYTSSLAINVAVNKIALLLTNHSFVIGFLCATFVSMCLNFLGQKYWVFR